VGNILLLALFVLMCAFFAGSEMALFSLSRSKVITLVNKKVPGAKLLKKLKDDPDRLLITLLIGNTVINIAASAVSTVLAIEAFGSEGIGIVTGILVFMLLTFGEIIPKALANRYAVQLAPKLAYPVYFFEIIFFPATFLFTQMIRIMNKVMGNKGHTGASITEDEIRAMAKLGLEEGIFESHEQFAVENIFGLNDLTVKKAMTPKVNVTVVDGDLTLSVAANQLNKKHHSRVPVYKDSPENIIGVLFVRDILREPRSHWAQVKVENIMKEPNIVRDNYVLIDLYEKFVSEKNHFAVVQNRSRQFVGVISIEDIFEEVLGEI
jgi:putative hemolysin